MPRELGDIVFADLLPGSIKDDPVVRDAAEALDAEVRAVTGLVPLTLLFSRMDELEEPVLSLLAHQLHVDFWESGWSLEVKREVLKGSTRWHKYKGTRFAVESLLQAMGYDAGVEESVEYGGDPYRFRVSVSGRMAVAGDYAGVMRAVQASKNVRSHLDAIVVTDVCDAAPKSAGVGSVVAALQGVPDHGRDRGSSRAPCLRRGSHRAGDQGRIAHRYCGRGPGGLLRRRGGLHPSRNTR